MSVRIKYGSRRAEQTPSLKTESVIFYSENRAELEKYVADHTINGSMSEVGRIVRTEYAKNGPYWSCTLTGETNLDENGISFVTPADGPQKHTLRTICVPVSLSRLYNYRVCWDHWLWLYRKLEDVGNAPLPPSGYNNRSSDAAFTEGTNRYAWTETQSAPTETVEEEYTWVQVQGCPTKPGIISVNRYTYQIVEYGDYDHESAAYWAVKKSLNNPAARPILGTFGITGGTWKLDDAQIEPNGKKWHAMLVWTWDVNNWDTDLYPPLLRSV